MRDKDHANTLQTDVQTDRQRETEGLGFTTDVHSSCQWSDEALNRAQQECKHTKHKEEAWGLHGRRTGRGAG